MSQGFQLGRSVWTLFSGDCVLETLLEARNLVADSAVDVAATVAQQQLALQVQRFIGGGRLIIVRGCAGWRGRAEFLTAVWVFSTTAAATAGIPGQAWLQDLQLAVDPNFVPHPDHRFPELYIAEDATPAAVDADFVGWVIASLCQQFPGAHRVVIIRGRVEFVDANGSKLRDVAPTFLQTVEQGLHDGLAVNRQDQCFSYLTLPQFRVPDIVGDQNVNLVVGPGKGLGDLVNLIKADIEGQVGFTGGDHCGARRLLIKPDLEDPINRRSLSVEGGIW